MAARAAPFATQPEVIDLMSDDSDLDEPTPPSRAPLELDANGDLSPLNELPFGGFFDEPAEDVAPAVPESDGGPPLRGEFVRIDGEDVWIPDEEGEPARLEPAVVAQHDAEMAAAMQDEHAVPGMELQDDHDLALSLNETFTVDTCLQRVLEIFPDINHEHVHTLYSAFDASGEYENLSGPARLDNIIEQLVSGSSYPKQEKGKQPVRKRKREASIDETDTKKWEREDRDTVPLYLKGCMQGMLKAEFPDIGVQYINSTLASEKHLYQAYVRLANVRDGHDQTARLRGKGRASKNLATADTMATNSAWPHLIEELTAARKRVEAIRTQRVAENEQKRAEELNLQRAKENGETSECSCCFDDLPLNRQIHCDGPTAHFTCFDCAENYVKAEVGESRCRVLCTAGCGAPFAPNQINLLSDKQLLEKLAELEQEKAIRDAGLEDLEECPFCDYKAIVPPVDEDFEFRCANPECEKVSCRRCKSTSHIPISCEQHAKNNKVNNRHKIEEAMTAAMLRSCNKCNKQFIKDYGCNKMACPSCGNLQCYVCSTTIKDYNHFDQAPNRAVTGATAKQCPLYDNVEERHEREVKEAEAAARAQVMQENPDVQPDDLEFKISDAVKKATAERIKKAGGVGGQGVGYAGMGAHIPAAARAILGFDGAEDGEDEDDEVDQAALLGLHQRAAIQQAMIRERVLAMNAARVAQRHAQPPPRPARAAAPVEQALPRGNIPVYGFEPGRYPNGLPNPELNHRLDDHRERPGDPFADVARLHREALGTPVHHDPRVGHAPAVGVPDGGLNINHPDYLVGRFPEVDFQQVEVQRQRQREQLRQQAALRDQQRAIRVAELRLRQNQQNLMRFGNGNGARERDE